MPKTITDYRTQLAGQNGGNDPYADLTDQQFAARLHEKHYSDIPLQDFMSRVGVQGDYANRGPGARPRTQPDNNTEAPRKSSYDTQLSGDQELAYRDWMQKIGHTKEAGFRVDDSSNGDDYDYRGFFKQNGPVELGEGQHLTDEFKKPNHETFSNESKYAVGDDARKAGSWDGDTYVPPAKQQIDPFRANAGLSPFAQPDEGKALTGPLKRLPGNIGRQAWAGLKQASAGARRGMAESAMNLAENPATADVYRDMVARGEISPDVYEERIRDATRATRAGRRATAQSLDAMPEDAGAIEQNVQGGLSSALVSVPIVTAGALVPGGQIPALLALGGVSAGQRYGQSREADVPEGQAALSAAYLGGLEVLTEKIPLGSLAKNSPFLKKAAEFLVTDILGENVSSAAQLADDYRLQLRDDVTMGDFARAARDTTVQTIIGAGAQLTVSGLMELVIDGANKRAQEREPTIEPPTLTDVVEPPTLGDDHLAYGVEEHGAGEDVTLGSDVDVEEHGPGEDIVLGGEDQPAPSRKRINLRTAPRRGGSSGIEVHEGGEDITLEGDQAASEPVADEKPSGPPQAAEFPEDVERRALEALKDGTATMGDISVAEASGYAKRRDDGTGMLLPAGRRRLIEMQTGKAPEEKPVTKSKDPDEDELTDAADAEVRLSDGGATIHVGGKPIVEVPDAARAREVTQKKISQSVTFKTSKGSTYTVDSKGRTTRDKAARPEHPGEQGMQPTSEATYYVSLREAHALGEFQVQGGAKRSVEPVGDGRIGVRYVDGPHAGKFEQRTVVTPKTEPAVGLYPVETWRGGRRVHFGNAITEVGGGEKPKSVSQRAHEAASSPKNELPEPSEAQQSAGNYKKGHVRVHGMDISVENPIGSMRRSKADAEVKWERKITKGHYGYIRGTEDNTGEHVDVFVGPSPKVQKAYVIDQLTPDAKAFDEPKVVLGARSEAHARDIYLSNYQKGWKGLGAITEMPIAKFKEWVTSRRAKKPVAWSAPNDRFAKRADALTAMSEQAGWSEVGGRAITTEDRVKTEVTGRTKWLPKHEWFADVQGAAPLPGNTTGKATSEAVRKALAGDKLTAAETRHLDAMLKYDDQQAADAERVMSYTPPSDEELSGMSDKEMAALEAKLERLAIQMADSDETPMFERHKDFTRDEIDAVAERIAKEHGLASIDLHLRSTGVELAHLEVEKSQRRTGRGSAAMRALTNWADENGVRLMLTPAVRDDSMGTTSRARLVSFYKRFGFIENKGRKKDFAMTDGMYREPQEALSERKDDTTGDMFGAKTPERAESKPARAPAAQNDLFGSPNDVANELQRIRAARDKKRNSGQESVETGKPDDLFSQSRQQADIEDKPTGEPLMRRSLALPAPAARPATVDDIRTEVVRVLAGFRTQPSLTVVDDYSQLPRQLRRSLERRGAKKGDVRAVQWSGGIYFIANEYANADDARNSTLHETVAHFGLRTVVDDATRNAILDGVARDQPMAVRRQGAREFGKDFNFNDEGQRRIAAEEVIAYYVPQYFAKKPVPPKMQRWLKQLIDAIEGWLRRTFGVPAGVALPEKYGREAIDAIIEGLAKNLRHGTTANVTEEGAQSERAEQTQTESFKRWFGSSKVVDSSGNPLVVYHGTSADFTKFRVGTAHGWGRGIYLTDNEAQARSEFGGQNGKAIAAYVSIQKPYTDNGVPDGVEGTKAWQRVQDKYQSPEDAWQEDGRFVGEALRELGYDGVIARDSNGINGLEVVAFEPTQVKSINNRGTFDPGNADILSERNAPMFYSALTRAVESSQTKRAPASQWLATIRNANGVKQEEVEWSGVEEWLTEVGRPVTRDELAGFLRANEVKIEEVVKGTESEDKLTSELDNLVVRLTARGYFIDNRVDYEGDPDYREGPRIGMDGPDDSRWHYTYEDGTWRYVREDGGTSLPADVEEMATRAAELKEEERAVNEGLSPTEANETRYSRWKTPGGENYREMLLTLRSEPSSTDYKDIASDLGVPVTAGRGETWADAFRRLPEDVRVRISDEGKRRAGKHYRSNHWDEPNNLAHVRFDERTDADGKRVLFIQEIQSDWHQAGRKRGYAGEKLTDDEIELQRLNGRMNDGNARISNEEVSRRQGLEAAIGESLRGKLSGVPNAPLKTSWPEFAFKRMLRWAAENGFDRVAWTTGEQQNKLYALSHHIDRIIYAKEEEGDYSFTLFKNGTELRNLRQDSVSADKLDDYFGADLARQMRAGAGLKIPGGPEMELEVTGEVGGAGMRGFYDDILPKMVAKLTKKWGGKVGALNISVPNVGKGMDGPGGMDNAENYSYALIVNGREYNRYDTRRGAEADQRVHGGVIEDQSKGEIEQKVHSVDVTDAMRDAALEGLPLFERPADAGDVMLRDIPKHTPEARGYAKLANTIIDVWNKKIGNRYGALGNLPDAKQYLVQRYKALGGLTQVREITRSIYDSLAAATPVDSERVYQYLTTAGATPDSIEDEKVRATAVNTKELIDAQGQALVQAGLLSEESYEAYRDQYLPRLYLRHLLADSGTGKAMGTGKKLSDMGYLKQRKDIPEEVRKVILGEITDPAFLASFGASRTMRDLTLMNFLNAITKNASWVPQKMLIEWDGRQVSPFWLNAEAKQLRRQADHIKNVVIAGKARAIADRMDTLANQTLEGLQAENLEDFKQIPDSARYGALRGLYVRKEIHEDLVGATNFIQADSLLESIFGQGGTLTKATQAWKTSKVALNVPSHFRNMMGNAMMLHLSGVNGAKLPYRLVQAITSIVTQDHHYQTAKRYGLKEATFANTELLRIRDEWVAMQKSEMRSPTANTLHKMWGSLKLGGAKVSQTVGDIYQFEEALFKIAKLIDEVEKGSSEADAMIEAHKWVFDYSLVPRWVRYLRNAPVGIPFLSYSYFALPRLAETAIKRPWKFLPYIAVAAAIHQALVSTFGGSDDDWKHLKNAYPDWMKNRGGMMLLPRKDKNGRWQVIDLGYTVPWGQLADMAAQLREGSFRQSAETMGIMSGPVPDAIAAWQTGIDPFTGREIANKGDPPWLRAQSMMMYAYGMAAPGFLTPQGAGGKIVDAYSDKVDPRTGEEKLTKAQAWMRLFGVSVYPVDPEATRETNLFFMQKDIDATRLRMGQSLRDKNLTDEQRSEIKGVYREEIDRRVKARKRYSDESEIPENLKRKRDLTSSIAPLIEGKSKAETVQALRDAGHPALAALFEDLPSPSRGGMKALQESFA